MKLAKMTVKLLSVIVFFITVISATVHSFGIVEQIAHLLPSDYEGVYASYFEYYNAFGGLYLVTDATEVEKAPYLFLVVQGSDHIRVKILEINHKEITLIWESEQIPGIFSSRDILRLDGRQNNEIILVTTEKNKLSPNYNKRYLWIISWRKESVFMLYPKNINDNKLVTEGYDPVDSVFQGDRILTINTNENGDRLVRYYKFQDQSLILDEEKLSVQPTISVRSVETIFKPYYILIAYYLSNKYTNIEIHAINPFGVDTLLYIAETNIGKIILKSQFDIVEEWYILDKKYSDFKYYWGNNPAYDLNGDGYPDLILVDPDDMPMGEVYYILSLSHTGYKLISPSREEDGSVIWGFIEPIDIYSDKDGNYLLYCFDKISEERMVWCWNKEKGHFEQIE